MKLTKEQLDRIVEAIGDDSNYPKMTDDPIINFYVDVETGVEDEYREWEDLPDPEKKLYEVEALLNKKPLDNASDLS
jgi:hypothetical protein